MLHAIIILEKSSGLCVFSENYTIDFDSTLFSGFLTAIQNFTENLKIGTLTSFITNDKAIVISASDYVSVALIIDLDDDVDEWFDKAYEIGQRFEEIYDMENWKGSLAEFNGFKDELKKLLVKKEENYLLAVAKWAKKEFGGEIRVNAILKPRKNKPKLKVDILLDRGDIDPRNLPNKLYLKRFQGLKKDLIFIKVVDGIVGRGEIKDFIEQVQEFGHFELEQVEEDIFPYFPKMVVIVGRDFSDTVKDLESTLYKVKNNKHYIQSKYLNLKVVGQLAKTELFNAYIEYWKWDTPYPIRIFK